MKSVLATAVLLLALASAGASASSPGSPLIQAVTTGHYDLAIKLIEEGADVRAREVDNTTALHYAAHYGQEKLVARLVEAGADVNAVNDYGSTPMSEAAITGNARILRTLIEAGADVESANAEGQTALMIVARTGGVEAAKLLLKHGARIDAREQWGGQTALIWAAAQSQPEMVKFLISRGADVNARSVVRDWQRRVTAEGRPKIMHRGGLTPLLYAAREGCIECVKHLLNGGADINLADPDGVTPLSMALMNMHFDLASLLIARGADLNKWDFYGRTPLYHAVDLNTLPRGGRPDLPSTDNLTGYHIAAMLLEAGANPNIQLKLRPPYRNGIFDRGGDQVISTGATPLLVAAKVGDAPMVSLLLRYGARLDIATSTGVTPTMAAAGMGHSFNPTRGRFKTDAQAAECLRLLVAAGGDVKGRNNQGLTALHSAASLGWDQTIMQLVAYGAELEAPDNKGLMPIDYAVGRHERAFLEPEHTPKEGAIALLTNYIVAATGRPPKEFSGNLNRATQGTGGALQN